MQKEDVYAPLIGTFIYEKPIGFLYRISQRKQQNENPVHRNL